jgi:hypothetical protein
MIYWGKAMERGGEFNWREMLPNEEKERKRKRKSEKKGEISKVISPEPSGWSLHLTIEVCKYIYRIVRGSKKKT